MALDVGTREVWARTLEDQPGGLASALQALSKAGVSLEFLIARRTPENQGHGVVFVTPISGKKQTAAAKAAGFVPTDSLFSVRIEAKDASGLGARVSQALADQNLNLRGFSGAALKGRAVLYVALDSREDAKRAVKILKGLK